MQTYNADSAAAVIADSKRAQEAFDPLGGASLHPDSAAASIAACTEDQVCDVEEALVGIREILKGVTIKVGVVRAASIIVCSWYV